MPARAVSSSDKRRSRSGCIRAATSVAARPRTPTGTPKTWVFSKLTREKWTADGYPAANRAPVRTLTTFLRVDPRRNRRLPSNAPSRRRLCGWLPFASVRLGEDFHLQAIELAGRVQMGPHLGKARPFVVLGLEHTLGANLPSVGPQESSVDSVAIPGLLAEEEWRGVPVSDHDEPIVPAHPPTAS